VAVACIVAGILLSMPGLSQAANSHMAEMDIMEYPAGKIEPAPDLALASLDGRTVNLRDLKGRPLLLVFWAST
jgi:cytochrome oxidase Cu insertion factor (SCO1/SenC/PrrC family)